MKKLTEDDFQNVKEDLKHGRISPDMIRFGLGAFMLFSAIAVGVAYMGVAASNTTIGWGNLSVFWRTIFKLEAIMFIIQLILIIFMKGKSNWSQILLNVSYVVYTYKLVLDPFVAIAVFAMDRDEYEIYAPIILMIIILGLILELYLIRRLFKKLKTSEIGEKKNEETKDRAYLVYMIPMFFLLTSITGYVISHGLLGEMDILAMIGICTLLLILILIGTIEFVIGAYCVIRFPSFRVNPPTEKNRSMH